VSVEAPAAPRYVIVAGGEPDAATLAALVVALTPVAVAPNATDEPEDRRQRTPAWATAALLEGIGGGPFVSADDLADQRVVR